MDSFVVEDGEELDGGELVKQTKRDLEENAEEEEEEEIEQEKKDWNFVPVCGMKYKPQKVHLELLKILFEVLINNSHPNKSDFMRTKKVLLELMGENYYSEETKYEEVYYNFQIFDIVCKECYLVMNVDLFLDLDDDHIYKCQCGLPYEKFQIENKIINMLKDFQKKINEPEFYCVNCRQIKKDVFFDRCLCGGEFQVQKDFMVDQFLEEKKNAFQNFK